MYPPSSRRPLAPVRVPVLRQPARSSAAGDDAMQMSDSAVGAATRRLRRVAGLVEDHE